MSEPRRLWTAVGAVALVSLGAVIGAGASAWQTRQRRADHWRAIHVEHQGGKGVTTHTRVVFDDAKLPIQSVALTVGADGKPLQATVALPDGELRVGYGGGRRPEWVEGADGRRAWLSYRAHRVWLGFRTKAGDQVAETVLTVPVELRPALRLSRAEPARDRRLATVWRWLSSLSVVAEARAAEPADEQVTVEREVGLVLSVRAAEATADGRGQIEASCPPFTCLPLTREVPLAGQSEVRIAVSGSSARSRLRRPASRKALAPFEAAAHKEREVATERLPQVARVVAAVGVVALGCAKRRLDWPICVRGLGKRAIHAAGAVHAVEAHRVRRGGPLVTGRAEQLYYQAQARAALDKPVRIEVCVSRAGYSRGCTTMAGRPFGAKPMARGRGAVALHRGLGGTLVGSFTLLQSDGADCKFSPSPKSSGKLSLSYHKQSGVMTAKLSANARGSRPGLRCSLGSGTMHWDQSYQVTARQPIREANLQAGGKLPLKLRGTMRGAGGFRWNGCRSSGGGSVGCPAGRRESYGYTAEVDGTLDLDRQSGSGRIVVSGAPLSTRGTWRIGGRGEK